MTGLLFLESPTRTTLYGPGFKVKKNLYYFWALKIQPRKSSWYSMLTSSTEKDQMNSLIKPPAKDPMCKSPRLELATQADFFI